MNTLIEPYSAAWYFQRWPKFYNEECYHILADYSANPEKYQCPIEEDGGVEESKDSEPMSIYVDQDVCEQNKNLKRKVCDCVCEP